MIRDGGWHLSARANYANKRTPDQRSLKTDNWQLVTGYYPLSPVSCFLRAYSGVSVGVAVSVKVAVSEPLNVGVAVSEPLGVMLGVRVGVSERV